MYNPHFHSTSLPPPPQQKLKPVSRITEYLESLFSYAYCDNLFEF